MTLTRIATYAVHFERLGRRHELDAVVESIADPDALAEGIARYARTKLASEAFTVTVDLEKGRGSVEFGRFGVFTFAEVGS